MLAFRSLHNVECNAEKPVAHNISSVPVKSIQIVVPPQPANIPTFAGPGTILKGIFSELGRNYAADSSCNCSETAALMDALGPEGCEQNFEFLQARLAANASAMGLIESAALLWNAVKRGYAFDLSASGLLKLAIQRSKKDRERANSAHKKEQSMLKWSYGVITTPNRRDLLERSLTSLEIAGFGDPLIGIDGCDDASAYAALKYDITCRKFRGDNFINWFLTANEVYLRDPFADLYAVFEDDLIISAGAREYIEKSTEKIDDGYFNLFTWPDNQRKVPATYAGWFIANQKGLGAVGLVFRRNDFMGLLSTPGMLHHARNMDIPPGKTKRRGLWYVDGLIVTAMSRLGKIEYCHSPSIVQHTGDVSAIGAKSGLKAPSFRGEEFDLRSLLK